MGGAVFPPCCLAWNQTMEEITKIMVTSFKRSHACTTSLSAPDPAAGHHWPGDSWTLTGKSGSVSCGVTVSTQFLLGPGVHKVLFVPSKSLFPQSFVSSGGSMVGLMVTSSKRVYATPRSAVPRALTPVAGHCWPVPSCSNTQRQVWLA